MSFEQAISLQALGRGKWRGRWRDTPLSGPYRDVSLERGAFLGQKTTATISFICTVLKRYSIANEKKKINT